MKIAILGTGMVGRTIAKRMNELGNDVLIGTRDITATMESEKPDVYGNPPFSVWKEKYQDISLKAFAEAAREAEVVFNCTSGQSSLAALDLTGEKNLKGKILIDVANPLDFSQGLPPFLNPVNTDSLGEQIQKRFPETHVVKTLNTMNANIMMYPDLIPGPHNVFVSGNEATAREKVKKLLAETGWQQDSIIDLGDITTARGTEMLLPIWLRLWGALGNASFNFHIQQG